MSAVHWAATVALDAAFALLVAAALAAFPASFADAAGRWSGASGMPRSSTRSVARRAAAIAFCAAVVDLVVRSLSMADAPLSALPALLPAVLAESRVGHVWLVEAGAIVVAWATVGRWRWWALAALVGWSASRAAVSHAASDGTVWPVAVQTLHALAMGAWSGSVWLAAGEAWSPSTDDVAGRADHGSNVRRLSTLATWSLATVVATGVAAAVRHVDSVAALTADDAYARWLRIKLACVALAALLGAVNRWHTLPPLLAGWRDADPAVGRLERRFRWLLWIESAALFAAIAVAAELASTEPPAAAQ